MRLKQSDCIPGGKLCSTLTTHQEGDSNLCSDTQTGAHRIHVSAEWSKESYQNQISVLFCLMSWTNISTVLQFPTYMRLAVPIPYELKFGSIAITFSKVRKTPRTELAHNKYSISGKILLLLLSLLLLFLLLFKA